VDDYGMRNTRTFALLALTTAGVLWGTTVPMTKVALGWLGPGWLAVVRFAIAALLLAIPARRQLRAAFTPAILGWGAAGFGVVLVVQNAGVARTSVSHGSLLNASIPILVAIIAAVSGKSRIGALSWTGFALATAGVIVVASGDGGSATMAGDGLVLASVGLCAAFVAAQPRMLAGRDPMAVTAVQFAAGAVVALPFALGFDGLPAAPTSTGPVLAVAGLIVGGTLLPFTLLAHGQARVAPEVAGAFLNLEPLVGALAGFVLFGDPAGVVQVLGALGVLGGIGLTAAPLLPFRLPRPSLPRPSLALLRGSSGKNGAGNHYFREVVAKDGRRLGVGAAGQPVRSGAGIQRQRSRPDVGGVVLAQTAQHDTPRFGPAERPPRGQERQREQAPRDIRIRRQKRGGRQYDGRVYRGVVGDRGGQAVRDQRRRDRLLGEQRGDLVEGVGHRGRGRRVGGRHRAGPEQHRGLGHERRPPR
jgi:O-acetylserine/cysteine efflux transporter